MEAINRTPPRTLEITVVSGESLCDDRTPVTEKVYVVVRAESLKCWSTKTARQDVVSLSTVWNEKLTVEVPSRAQSITFEVHSKAARAGVVGSIGLARIAIWDVIPKEGKCLEMLSYRLRNWEGRRSGVINFSVKVVNKEHETEKEKDSNTVVDSADDLKPETIGVHHHHHHQGRNANKRCVMGIPVWWWSLAGIRV